MQGHKVLHPVLNIGSLCTPKLFSFFGENVTCHLIPKIQLPLHEEETLAMLAEVLHSKQRELIVF